MLRSLSLFAVAILFIGSSCTYHNHSHKSSLPPGQAKKLTGSKSAKPYAPGQQKKHH